MNDVSKLTTARADYARHSAAAVAMEMEIIGLEAKLKRTRTARENAIALADDALDAVKALEDAPIETAQPQTAVIERKGPLFPQANIPGTTAPVDQPHNA